ncbi:hypothetical protein ACFQY4_26645 [Catellatospora bangladeshensis]
MNVFEAGIASIPYGNAAYGELLMVGVAREERRLRIPEDRDRVPGRWWA